MNYKVYRLCRDNKRINDLRRDSEKYSLPKTDYITGVDIYTFINNIILNCNKNYALLCHDDIVLPLTIDKHIQECIKSANDYMGEENWAVIGNAGIEILTKKVLHYLTDPDIKIIPPYTKYPKLVESIDGNTMLLNIKNLRKNRVSLPKDLTGFHLYDIILCLEAQKKGLLCAVSSHLFVSHLSGGNRQAFVNSWKSDMFQSYFSKTFSNKVISSLNGEIIINKSKKKNGISIEEKIKDNILTVRDKKYELNIISRKTSQTLEDLIKKRNNSIIKLHIGEDIKGLVKAINSEDSYTIILDEWDSLNHGFLPYLPYMISSSNLIVGDTIMTSENNFITEKSSEIEDIYTGKREKPLNIIIYKTSLLKKIINSITFENPKLNEFELFLEGTKQEEYKTFPIVFGERQYDGKDYKIIDSSFTTMLSEVTNRASINNNFYNFYRNSTMTLEDRIHKIGSEHHSIKSFKNSILWKLLLPVRRIYSLLKRK